MTEPINPTLTQRAVLRAEIFTVKGRAEEAHGYGKIAHAMVVCGIFTSLFLIVDVFIANQKFNGGCAAASIITAALFITAGFFLALRVRTLTSSRFDAENAQTLLEHLDRGADLNENGAS